jgi:nicotinamidase-related amidase
MRTIEIVDRSAMTDRLKRDLEIDPGRTAIIPIDMHRGHLDPSVATMPAQPEQARQVIAAAEKCLDHARRHKVQVIHVKLVWRNIPGLGSEGMTVPFWRALHEIAEEENRLSPGRRSTVKGHNLMGSPGTEIIPSLYREGDWVIDNKKRLDCFMGTDLENLLTILKVKTVALMGINTNTCVLNTAFTAFNKDYQVVVISDCVASMYGDDLHVFGLENVKRCLGWVLTGDEFAAKLEAGVPRMARAS